MMRGNILLIILVTAGILATLVGGYFWWQSQKLQNLSNSSSSGTLPTTVIPTIPKEKACSANNDCAIGIKTPTCCGCPTAINKKFVGSDGWELYVSGKDYSKGRQTECSEIKCKPCAGFGGEAVCKIEKDGNKGCLIIDQGFPL